MVPQVATLLLSWLVASSRQVGPPRRRENAAARDADRQWLIRIAYARHALAAGGRFTVARLDSRLGLHLEARSR
jgi:hypothetical protein